MNTFVPITILKGVGEKRARIYEKLGIKTIDDMIHYYPRDYELNKEVVSIKELTKDQTALVHGEIIDPPTNFRIKKLVITKMKIRDDSGVLNVSFYNQPYMKNNFHSGQKVYLKGKVHLKYSQLQMESPKVLHQEDIDALKGQELLPIYRSTKDISSKMLTELIRGGLNYTGGQLKDYLPSEVKERFDLSEYNYALSQIHNPSDGHALELARKRLIFDEFLLFQLGLQLLKSDHFIMENDFVFEKSTLVDRLLASLPYNLTGAQTRVWEEIKKDLQSKKVMNRLVQGDVGSGKTIVAAMGLLFAVDNGYQGAMMVPTEVLAKQHYRSLKDTFEVLGVKAGLLIGSMTKKQKEETYQLLQEGELDVVIGTHAVIQEGVQFKNLALVITDEQHRFGVKQRETLASKGDNPNILVMSATPIPRTLALIVYGDMDVSIIDELPPGRQSIKTYSVNSGFRDRIYTFMKKEIEAGRQCYIVCPMVEENEELDLESVITYTSNLKDILPDIRITYLHGQMPAKDKNAIMESFANGEIDILVSTTVIEVGVNVPNATLMLIENAERFGLAGLHQLRGRVGRGQHQSYCILMTDSDSEITKKRMQVMAEYTDGFVISEYDLKLRGPGDAFGIKQSGLPEFKIGDLFQNADILKETHDVVTALLEEDPNLSLEKHLYLKRICESYFESTTTMIAL